MMTTTNDDADNADDADDVADEGSVYHECKCKTFPSPSRKVQ
jgi:hypothetical protein